MKGLVLEGGGVKGAYQIGSYYAFKDCHITLDGFVGTSIGSFNACMLASNKAYELLKFWYYVNPGDLFNFDDNFVKSINDKKIDLKSVIGAFSTLKQVTKNLGIDNNKMMSHIYHVVNYDDLESSKKDFGLVTVRLSGFKPIYVYKEQINNQEELMQYLMASCYFPAFREHRLLDNHIYIDGGFYDNAPIKLLSDKGYDTAYVINVKGLGFYRDIPRNIHIVEIKPSRDNGLILELDRSVIRDNIMMGYYDTLRVLKNLDGYKYCFKKRSDRFYEFIARKVDKRLFRRVQNFFDVYSYKDCIIKSLEYICEYEHVSYYDVYSTYGLIRKFRKIKNKKFIYRFIRELRFF